MAADKRKSKRTAKSRAEGGAREALKDPGPPYTALWHSEADAERDASWPAGEKVAMLHAVQKLERQVRSFTALECGWPRGYDAAVARAAKRFVRLEAIEAEHGDSDNNSVIILDMKLTEIKRNDELVAEQLRVDPEFRAEWERTALARAVALAIGRYRAEHELSQRALGERLGMKQPQVARLELGEVNPSMETLMRISSRLRIEFTIDVRPAGTPARNLTDLARQHSVVGTVSTDDAELLVAAR